MKFVNLYTETEYSLLSSSNKINELIRKAKENNYDALAITDYNNMYGAIKFYCACMSNGIKPILGLHLDINDINVLLYAKNNAGFKEIIYLSTLVKIESESLKLDALKNKTDNCIAIIPGDENTIVKKIISDDLDTRNLHEYKSVFKDLYLGVDLQTYSMKQNIDKIISFSKNNEVPLVAINKTSYLDKDYFEAYLFLKCIGLGLNEYPYSEKEMNLSLLSRQEAEKLFNNYPELINNTSDISNKCNVILEFNKYHMPLYINSDFDKTQYLKELSLFGLKKRISNKKVNALIYKNRLLYELDVIIKMGFVDYFLIVYDYIKHAKNSGILVGPGRGSAPGSLVAYSLGITEIDPIEHELLFERFLNPERTSMPDIDIDFPDNRRDEMISYMGKKYGKDKVAHISTFGTFGVRLAIRDVARVIKLDEIYLNEILKNVVNKCENIEEVVSNNPVLKQMARENELVNKLLDVVKKIQGLPRHISVHAAGIIMADSDLINYTPLQEGINGLYQTQFEAGDLEKIGLVKFDFLGLRNLNIIDSVLKEINKEEKFSLNDIDYNDEKTYSLLANGDTDGVFQLESPGMRKTLIKLKTSKFIDIVNAIALYRPGPMDMIPSFIKRKLGEEAIVYIHNDLKEILKPTYGTIVFQEQILLIAQKFAGFSLGQADILRRAVSKKNMEMMKSEREKFIIGAQKNGHDEKISNMIYDYIVKFADYGFNKSHSVAYSILAYQMAYLKTRYYKYFMAELMSNTIGNIRLIKSYILDCKKQKIPVFLPSVNESSDKFLVKNEGIYYSILGIQDVGMVSVDGLIKERSKNGLFKDYDDFVFRTKSILTKRMVENMICAGALDCFNVPRKQMILEYDNSIERSKFSAILFDKIEKRAFSDEEFTFEELSKKEYEALGFNLKYDIFNCYESLKKKVNALSIMDLKNGSACNIVFYLSNLKIIKTKNNKEMAFLTIRDDTAVIDGVIFPNIYQMCKDILEIGKIYLGNVKADMGNGKQQVIFEKLAIVKKQ